MSVMIDMLELNSVLDEDSAEMLDSIRRVRNKASHESRIPSVEDIAKALKLAVSYIKSTPTGLDIDSEHLRYDGRSSLMKALLIPMTLLSGASSS
jgi:uncharacterized protein DUF4145